MYLQIPEALWQEIDLSGIGPQRTYGAGVFGVAPSVVLGWRRTIARTLAPGMKGRCLDTLLQIECGAKDPFISTAFQLLDAWIFILSLEAERGRASVAWPRALAKIQLRQANRRWRCVTGVTYAMICLLLDLGWQPAGPWDWTSDEGERFYIPDDAWELDLDWGAFKQSFAASLDRALWARAASHFCGGGLQKGTDLTNVKAQLRRLQQRDDKRHWYGAVRATVT